MAHLWAGGYPERHEHAVHDQDDEDATHERRPRISSTSAWSFFVREASFACRALERRLHLSERDQSGLGHHDPSPFGFSMNSTLSPGTGCKVRRTSAGTVI